MSEKLKVTKNEIQKLIENEIRSFKPAPAPKLEDMAGGLGDEPDRQIGYSKADETSGQKPKFKLKEPIPELLEYINGIEEASAILTRCAAAHKNDDVQKKLYNHYQKSQKLVLELIKEFGIVR